LLIGVPPRPGGVGGGTAAVATTPARETAPEPSDDEGTARFITQDREGGTANNNLGANPLADQGLGHTPSTTSVRSSHLRLPSSPAQEGVLTLKIIYPKLCYLTSETDDRWHMS
jgi:hypothetical protein